MLSGACAKKKGNANNKNTHLSSFHIQNYPCSAWGNKKKSFHTNSPKPSPGFLQKKPSPTTLGSPTTQAAQDLELGFKEAQRRPGEPKVDVAKM